MAETEIRICLGLIFDKITIYFRSNFLINLEKETMDVWVNGAKVETTGEFVDEGGTKTHFEIGNGSSCYILSQSSGKRQIG